MPEPWSRQPLPIPDAEVEFLIGTAARAPSLQNTQPWRFRVLSNSIELYADLSRKLRVDRQCREMPISCGGALFGLRLALRSLGLDPVVELFPEPVREWLLARVQLHAGDPMTAAEQALLQALLHRHTHRGPFEPEPLPDGLIGNLEAEAAEEGATLALVDRVRAVERLADIVASATLASGRDEAAGAEMREWTRASGSGARDGVPATAFATESDPHRGRLRQRDFDLGRGLGLLSVGGPPPAATAVLLTPGDTRGDWMCAGQALHRVLTRAAASWVFGSLYTEPLEEAQTRWLVADRLVLAGAPQMILQLGLARSARAAARRPPAELVDP